MYQESTSSVPGMEAWTTGRPTDRMRHKLIMYLEYNGEEEAKNVSQMVPTGNECMRKKGDNNSTVGPFQKVPRIQSIWNYDKVRHAKTTATNKE